MMLDTYLKTTPIMYSQITVIMVTTISFLLLSIACNRQYC